MILPDFILPSRINQCWYYSGLDSPEYCQNNQHFKSYPYQVEYKYNNRGFRDQEWPLTIDELKQSVWCVGDSFTVGLGSPVTHIWPYLLQQKSNQRTINISLDGASNDWIFRKAVNIINTIQPKTMVIHWSYVERVELSIPAAFTQKWPKFYKDIRDNNWPESSDFESLPTHIQQECVTQHLGLLPINDEDRRIGEDRRAESLMASISSDIQRTLNYVNDIDQLYPVTKIVHSFVPNFLSKKYIKDFNNKLLSRYTIPEFAQLDFARDYHHYDIKTAEYFTDEILKILDQHY